MFLGAFLRNRKTTSAPAPSTSARCRSRRQSQNAIVALAYVELIAGPPDRAQALARRFLGTPNSDEGWWASKNGTLDHAGLQWLRQRVRNGTRCRLPPS